MLTSLARVRVGTQDSSIRHAVADFEYARYSVWAQFVVPKSLAAKGLCDLCACDGLAVRFGGGVDRPSIEIKVVATVGLQLVRNRR